MQAPGRPAAHRGGGPRLRADRRAQTSDSLVPAFVAAAVILTLLAPLQPLLSPGRLGAAMSLITAVLAAGFWGAWLACLHPRVRAFVRRHAHEVGLAACLFASLGHFAELVLLGRPDTAGPLMVFLLAAGALTNRRRYSAAITVVCLVEWFTVAAAHGFSGDWAALSAMVLCAAVLAAVLNSIRCRAADGLVRAQAAVLASARTDDLTGLANRRGLLAAAADLLPAASRDAPLGVLFLDLDDLKGTNDREGHAAGDRLVLATADALVAAVRPGDVVARLGGDEFAVLLPTTSPEQAQEALDRVRRLLKQSGIAASTGLALGTATDRMDHLLHAADSAMYAVKQQRRRRTTATEPAGPAAADGWAGRDRPAPGGTPPSDEPAGTGPADLRRVARTGAWLHLAAVPAHHLLLPATTGPTMAAGSLALAAAFALLHVAACATWSRRWTVAHPAGLMTTGLLLLCAEALRYVALVAEPWTSLAVVLAVVGTGGALTSRTSAAVLCLATFAGWLVVAAAQQPEQGWARHGVTLLSALCIAALLNITHRRTVARLTAAQDAVRVAAVTDELTGLSNRRGFLSAARSALDSSVRRGIPVSVLYLDLDGLKLVNDQRGHAAGDDLLTTAADVLRRVTGPEDVCARFGGDEFTLLLPGCPAAEVPTRVRRIEDALAAQSVSASIGVAQRSGDGRSLHALLDEADDAMFAVKRRRRAEHQGREPSLA